MKQGWEIKKLGEVCEVIGGSTPKTNEPTYWDGDFFWVTPAELDGTKLISSTKRTITEAGIKSAHLQLLPAGTVLLSSRAPIGKVAITTVPMYCNQGFKNIICSDKLYNCYVYWFLYAKTEYLNALGTGATFKEISKKVVEQIPIPVPPLPVQERIVSELDLLSGIIEKKREQLKEFDALAQSIFYDMFGDPITNEKGWEVKKLGEVAPAKEYKGEIPNKDGKYWLLNLDMVTAHTGEIIEQCYFEPNEIGNSTIVFNGENVLYSKLRPYLNKVVLPKDIGFATSELVPLFPNKLQLDRMYLAHTLRSSSFVEYISAKVAGAKMPRVSMNEFRTFPIPLPPLPLQHQFASKIEAIERQKELIKQSISETETLFNARMQEHFG